MSAALPPPMASWTETEVRAVRRRLIVGQHIREIAAHLGRPTPDVDLMLWVGVGLPPRDAAERVNHRIAAF